MENVISAQEIKRRGISAVDQGLRKSPACTSTGYRANPGGQAAVRTAR